MLDRRFLRENPDAVRAATARRGVEIDFDRLLELDRGILDLQQQRQELKEEQNRLSKAVPTLQGDEKAAAIARSRELGAAIKPLEGETQEREEELAPLLLEVPNLLDDEVPDGRESADNVEVRRVGNPPSFDFPIKDHLDLGTDLGLIDTDHAVKLAGSRTYFLKGDLVLLELAVLRYALDRDPLARLPALQPAPHRQAGGDAGHRLPAGAARTRRTSARATTGG